MNEIEKTRSFVREKFLSEGSGHDWWHIQRVWRLARFIAEKEQANFLIVELAALLHDIADWKFHGGDQSEGPRVARQWLEKIEVDTAIIGKVCKIIEHISFKGAKVKDEMPSLEGKCVQDADRLDAIGAIGIARTFAYGGHKGNPIYVPQQQPTLHDNAQDYFEDQSHTINHFHEKLLLLKDRLHTQTAKDLAEERHRFMELFLEQFHREWDFGKNAEG